MPRPRNRAFSLDAKPESAQALICGSSASTEPMATGRWQRLQVLGFLLIARWPRTCARAGVQQEQGGQLRGEGLGGEVRRFQHRRVMYDSLHSRTMALVDTPDGQRLVHAQRTRACYSAASVSRQFQRTADRDDQRTRVGHAVAVAIFAGDFSGHRSSQSVQSSTWRSGRRGSSCRTPGSTAVK